MSSLPRSGRSPGGGNGNPPQYSCLENPIDREAWQATGHGITESDTAERLITHTWKSSSPSVSVLSYREQNLSSGYTQCLMMSIRKQSTLWLKDSWVCKDHWLSRGGHGYSGDAQGMVILISHSTGGPKLWSRVNSGQTAGILEV